MRKGYSRSGIAPKDAVRPSGNPATYDGIETALRRYHGETQAGVDRYSGRTMMRAENLEENGMIQPGKGKEPSEKGDVKKPGKNEDVKKQGGNKDVKKQSANK